MLITSSAVCQVHDVCVCVCEHNRTCGPSAVSVVSVFLCSHRLQDQWAPAGAPHSTLPKTRWQTTYISYHQKPLLIPLKRNSYDPQRFLFGKVPHFDKAFMWVVISALQSFPFPLPYARPRHLFSQSCLRLSCLFVLRVRKQERRNALLHLFQWQHS